jgi:hypothetical protein
LNPIVALNKPGAIHNSAHFPAPDGLGPPVADLGVVIFRWDVKGARVEKGLQSEEGPGHPEGFPSPTVGQYYSVPVLLILKRVCVLARDSDSALAPRAGGLRKTANVIHPPPTSSSNAPKTEKRLGRGAVKSGA